MFGYWRHLSLLSIESHCVITMRMIKLTGGGAPALDEAWRILVEKAAATANVPQHVLDARSPLVLVMNYRKMVRGNLRRLSAKRNLHETKPS